MAKDQKKDPVSAKLEAVRARQFRARIQRAVDAGLPPLALTREDAAQLQARQRNAGQN